VALADRETAAEHIRNALTLVAFGGCTEGDAITARLRAALREVEAGNMKNPAAYALARRAGFRSVPKRARRNPIPVGRTSPTRRGVRGRSELEAWDAIAGQARRIVRTARNAGVIQDAQNILTIAAEMTAQVRAGVHENPTLAVLGNPPARVVGTLSRRLYELRYKHASDGKDYRHPFGPGASILLLADGSVLIRSKQRLWEDL
jgi:hypothetical protein